MFNPNMLCIEIKNPLYLVLSQLAAPREYALAVSLSCGHAAASIKDVVLVICLCVRLVTVAAPNQLLAVAHAQHHVLFRVRNVRVN